jgi:hypothetical protein
MTGTSHVLSAFLAASPWWLYAAVMAGLALHIGGGAAGVLSGYAAVSVKKGERLHRKFGTIFLASMLVMATAATTLAIVLQERENIAAGILAIYLVTTAWMTVKREEGRTGWPEKFAMVAILATSVMFFGWGLQARAGTNGALAGFGSVFYFVFAGITAFLAMLDIKVIWQGGVSGVQRITRHLWRMCFAFFFAAGSFFLGQQKIMPKFMHGSPVLWALGLAPLAFMIFWLIRIRFAGRPNKPAIAS